MAKTETRRLKFLMDVDEAILKVEKEFPANDSVEQIKNKFYSLAGREFPRSVIGEIHELTIEETLKKQAEQFYKNFPAEIQRELVHTFIQMEHQRRRDNFLDFSLFLFKQIECYINYLFANGKLLTKIISIRKEKTYVTEIVRYSTERDRTVRHEYSFGYSVQSVILRYTRSNRFFSNSDYDILFENNYNLMFDVDRANTNTKFRTVSYILLYNQKVDDLTFEINNNIYDEIYQLRNAVHGGKFSIIKQKIIQNQEIDGKEKILYDSWQNRYNNYLRYSGFLADFMKKVSNSPNLSLLR